MYPNFEFALEQLTGADMPDFLNIFQIFGLFVALAFIASAWVLTSELKRKEKLGLLQPSLSPVKDKKTGETKQVLTYPHQRVSEIVIICAVAGLLGAKIFNAFETWDNFIQDPIGNLFSRSGLTFYGGLICATLVLMYYARKHKIGFKHLCDAAAPALILGYGIGRLGCHFSGDGDWGIFNSAYITHPDGSLHLAATGQFEHMLQVGKEYFVNNFGSISTVPHLYAPAPSWLPDWLYAMNYAHNVNGEGIAIAGCTGNYCGVLPVGVFPTPLYEAVVCSGIFAFLWAIRRKINIPLQMFGIYLIFNGAERFLVEKIRVNYKYDWGFLHPTQAEIISSILILIGIGILIFTKKKQPQTA
ncbi:MAG: prolipoprotein diacylglyceryl transferase [Flavipsychrobacter sp.]|nr:prolipoprotein diacylglyceryl transferase [Flavipsychrobacter sp.]